VAIDPVIPKIRIKTRQADTLFDKRIVVSIDRWDRTSKFPSGHYVKTLGNTPPSHSHSHSHLLTLTGKIGDRDVESEALLIQHEVPYHPFSEAVLACLPKRHPWVVTDEELPGRFDLRELNVCSVDPPGILLSLPPHLLSFNFFWLSIGCTDIDDALHVESLPNGNFSVGVHILFPFFSNRPILVLPFFL